MYRLWVRVSQLGRGLLRELLRLERRHGAQGRLIPARPRDLLLVVVVVVLLLLLLLLLLRYYYYYVYVYVYYDCYCYEYE